MIIIENNDYIEVTCPHCQSKLGVHCEDIIDNDVGPITTKCVVCNRTINITLSQIPSRWNAKLFKQ